MKLTDDSQMPFGQHKGRKMEDVPAQYLMYLWGENSNKFKDGKIPEDRPLFGVMEYIEDNLDVLKKEIGEYKISLE